MNFHICWTPRASRWLVPGTAIQWDLTVIAAAQQDSLPSPFQVYSTWLRAGVPGIPSREALLQGWTTEDRMICERDFGGCIVPGLLVRMQAKWSDTETEANEERNAVWNAGVVDELDPYPMRDELRRPSTTPWCSGTPATCGWPSFPCGLPVSF